MSSTRRWIPLSLLVVLAVQLGLGEAERSCPSGQVLGSSGHCVFKDQCPDGSLPRNGKCFSVDAVTPQPEIQKLRSCKTTLTGASVAVSPTGGCSAKKMATKRKVFLSNGKAAEVFTKYLQDAEQLGTKIELGYLTVYFFDSSNQQRSISAPKMSMAHYFSGKSIKDLWKKVLASEEAQPRQDPLTDAQQLDADATCGD